jgi:hypothetical protein
MVTRYGAPGEAFGGAVCFAGERAGLRVVTN